MQYLILLLSLPIYVAAYEIPIAINCGCYDRTLIVSKYVNFTGDSYFQGIASDAIIKQKLPESISNLADRQLMKTHRVLNQGYDSFSYMPIIDTVGHHVAIFSFVETQFKARNQRVFNIKIGEWLVHTVDIYAEAGFGKILHKSAQFTIENDIVYLNGTIPILNGYNYRMRQVRFKIQRVTGPAKLESLIVVKGSDATIYLNRFLQYQHEKNSIKKQYVSDKYRRIPSTPYRFLTPQDLITDPPSQLSKFITKYVSLRSLACILCALFAIHNDSIISYMQKKVDEAQQKNKQSNKQKKQ